MSEKEAKSPRINCVLIAGGVWHDIDFARLELLKLLSEDESVRTRVFEDYENLEALDKADILISYTCDVTPSLKAQEALRAWLTKGGRWYALHGTNSVLRMLTSGPDAGKWDAPRWAPLMMDLLGSQFISHPAIEPYMVTVADPAHPLMEGIEAFETTDELYHLETHGHLHVLLATECTAEGTGLGEAAGGSLRVGPAGVLRAAATRDRLDQGARELSNLGDLTFCRVGKRSPIALKPLDRNQSPNGLRQPAQTGSTRGREQRCS